MGVTYDLVLTRLTSYGLPFTYIFKYHIDSLERRHHALILFRFQKRISYHQTRTFDNHWEGLLYLLALCLRRLNLEQLWEGASLRSLRRDQRPHWVPREGWHRHLSLAFISWRKATHWLRLPVSLRGDGHLELIQRKLDHFLFYIYLIYIFLFYIHYLVILNVIVNIRIYIRL